MPKDIGDWIRTTMRAQVEAKGPLVQMLYVQWALRNWEVISTNKEDLGNTSLFPMTIETKTDDFVYRPQFRIPDALKEPYSVRSTQVVEIGVNSTFE